MKLVIFEIAQPAMHQLGRKGRRPARQVIHFTEDNRIAPACRVARDAAAVDAAAYDREVEDSIQRRIPGARLFTLAVLLSVWSKSQPNVKATEKGKLEKLDRKHPGRAFSDRIAKRGHCPILLKDRSVQAASAKADWRF
jgi:hypothetical protein